MDHSLNSLNNFDFLARSFARMHAEGRPVDILAVTGNMDEEHRTWFCARYAWYCQQMMPVSHESVTGLVSVRRILRGSPDRDASAALVGFGGFFSPHLPRTP